MHIFRLYDENNVLIHEYKNLKCNAGDNLKDDLNHIVTCKRWSGFRLNYFNY